ncbi:MAG: YraN family protein [Limisphaerales bacterium]
MLWRLWLKWWEAWKSARAARVRARTGTGSGSRTLWIGHLGEQSARRHLEAVGMKFLTANYRTKRGEIDLVFRDGDCLVFVEVKARSSEAWGRPAAAVDSRKRRALSRVALEYLRSLKQPRVRIRFDVVEVLLAGDRVREVRHLPNTFPLSAPYRYG